MVFQYTPGARPAAPELPNPPTYDRTHEDPFTVDPSLSVETRISWLGDAGIWTQQMVSECASTARKLEVLKRKLADPALAESPHRQSAVYRADAMRDDMLQHARDAAWTEAQADRYWQTLTWKQRDEIAGHWHTPCSADRLIGRAWFGIATFETWPRWFRLPRLAFNDFPWPLINDMNEANVWAWEPSPGGPDPWTDETSRLPMDIAIELEKRT